MKTSTREHFSTKTQTWNKCQADKQDCRYSTHRPSVVQEPDKEEFYKQMVENALPEEFTLAHAVVNTMRKRPANVMKLAEPGTTGKRCFGCEDYLPAETVSQIDNFENFNNHVPCPKCGTKASWSYGEAPYEVEVTREEAEYLISKQAVKERVWYHATTVENWGEDIMEAGVYIHAGSKDAAEERIKAVKVYTPTSEYYVYELKLKNSSQIADEVYYDDNDWPEVINASGDRFRKDNISSKKMNRYVNSWEHAGSVSLLGDPNLFEIVGMKVVKS